MFLLSSSRVMCLVFFFVSLVSHENIEIFVVIHEKKQYKGHLNMRKSKSSASGPPRTEQKSETPLVSDARSKFRRKDKGRMLGSL